MKALTLRQPWAWLVLHGKGIENRVWDTKRRGQFLIHAAKGMTRAEHDDAVAFAREVDPTIIVPPPAELHLGGIVGRARLVDVIPPCPTEEEARGSLFKPKPCSHPWHMAGQFGFVLADVAPIDFIPLRGMLGFFDVTDVHHRAVWDARKKGIDDAEIGARFDITREQVRQICVREQAKEQSA